MLNKTLFIVVLVFTGCLYQLKGVSNLEPMYGNHPKTARQVQADQKFVATMTKRFGSRRHAAQNAVDTGWDFFKKGDHKTAMKRFNQAWLLDPNLANVYEGFGVLLVEQGRYDSGVQMLRKALDLDPNNQRIRHNLNKAVKQQK